MQRFPEAVDTERLALRRWAADDLDEVLAVWAAGDVWERLRPGIPFDEAIARIGFQRHIEHWLDHGFGLWTLREPPSELLIGWVGASHPAYVPALAHEVEIGWTLRPEARGRGLAREAALAARDAAFRCLDVPRVISLIETSNEPSRRVAIGIGMRRDRVVRHPQLGRDLDVYALERARQARENGL